MIYTTLGSSSIALDHSTSEASLGTANQSWIYYGLRKIFNAIGSLFSQSNDKNTSSQPESRAFVRLKDVPEEEESPGYILRPGISQLLICKDGQEMTVTIYDPNTRQGIGLEAEIHLLETEEVIDRIDEE